MLVHVIDLSILYSPRVLGLCLLQFNEIFITYKRVIFFNPGKDRSSYYWHGRDSTTIRELNPKVLFHSISYVLKMQILFLSHSFLIFNLVTKLCASLNKLDFFHFFFFFFQHLDLFFYLYYIWFDRAA